MRLRRRPETPAKMAKYSDFYLINEPTQMKGQWHTVFGNDNPLHLEIGCGKGQFVIGMAEQNPGVNFIAMELHVEVIAQALKKVDAAGLKNIRFVRDNANTVDEFFAPEEIDRIYLNFSDPWPKSGHYKRRLTYRGYLDLYTKVLKKGEWLHFKTDNLLLFEYSLNEFAELGLQMKSISLDLHRKEPMDNVRTEYEEKFGGLGFKINRVEVCLDALRK